MRTHCARGHEYTPENTRTNPDGSRRCRACLARWNAKPGEHVERARHDRCRHGHEYTPENTRWHSSGRRWCRTCQNEAARRARVAAREQVIAAYGGRCSCCGEAEPLFLTIDHINGGGVAHFRKLGSSVRVYLEIIRQGFPTEYRLLCYNCNCGREHNGGICPHVLATAS